MEENFLDRLPIDDMLFYNIVYRTLRDRVVSVYGDKEKIYKYIKNKFPNEHFDVILREFKSKTKILMLKSKNYEIKIVRSKSPAKLSEVLKTHGLKARAITEIIKTLNIKWAVNKEELIKLLELDEFRRTVYIADKNTRQKILDASKLDASKDDRNNLICDTQNNIVLTEII